MTLTSSIQAEVSFTPNAVQTSYLEAQMNAVSRSFAVVVACLEEPLRTQLATAYILCRVADSIEDCTESAAWKADRFADFEILLSEPQRAPDILPVWSSVSWTALNDNEQALMGRGGSAELWRIYAAQPPAVREILHHWVWEMTDEMRRLNEPDRNPIFLDVGDVKVLAAPTDYDRYCYIVAGTVGIMATELVARRYDINGATGHRLLATSEACGRALQKTNILQDFVEDVERGFCYLPDAWLQMADRTPLTFSGAPAP